MRDGPKSIVLLLFGLLLCAETRPAVPVGPPLTERHHHDLRCAAAFAVVAVAQTRGDSAALALPPVGIRGKRYMGQVGERVAAETGLSGEAVHDLLIEAARSVTRDGATTVASGCMGDLDGTVPPRPAPDAVACLGLLGVYADVLAARGAGDSALARTLARESARLAPAAHGLLVARGLDDAGQIAAIDRQRAVVRQALNGGPGAIDADDFVLCRKLAGAAPG